MVDGGKGRARCGKGASYHHYLLVDRQYDRMERGKKEKEIKRNAELFNLGLTF